MPALLAVVNSVREFGRAITVPLGAPAGTLTAFIEVSFTSGERNLRPDGVLQVNRGSSAWTALVEVKTGANELRAAQVESTWTLPREQGFDAVVTISNQLVGAPGEHPVAVDKRKTRKVALYHLSWSQIRTEALIEQANKAVSDPDQAWILAEFIRYLEHPRSGAAEFEDMGPSWVAVREAARARSLQAADKGAKDVARRFEQLISYAAMRLSRELGVEVRAALSRADLKDPDRRVQDAATVLAETGILVGSLRVPERCRADRDHRRSQSQPGPVCHHDRCAQRGEALTRLNWLLRQLRDTSGRADIEAIALRQRGKGPVRALAEVRETPKLLVDDPKRELRAFTVLDVRQYRNQAREGTRRLHHIRPGCRRRLLRRRRPAHRAVDAAAAKGPGRARSRQRPGRFASAATSSGRRHPAEL